MWQIVAMVVIAVLQYMLRPKPQTPITPPPGDVEGTTVDSASPVPVLFGTRLMKQPNCIWYGDIGTTPIINCSGGKK